MKNSLLDKLCPPSASGEVWKESPFNLFAPKLSLADRLYLHESEKSKEVWKKLPFKLFHPEVPFFRFSFVRGAIENEDEEFFAGNVRYNFFPDKNKTEVLEAKRRAINRGIDALNGLCVTNLQEYAQYFQIQPVNNQFEPLKMATEARQNWIKARNGKHKKTRDYQELFKAYNFARNWGLGHMVLILDEAPEIFHSVHYTSSINEQIWNILNFENPSQVSDETFAWDTRAKVRVYGTKSNPFKHRAKIHDEEGRIKYNSLLMKLFLKELSLRKGFLDTIHDTYGIELLVSSEEEADKLLHFFMYIKGTTTLEKYERIEKEEPPAYSCHKFLFRTPIRIQEKEVEDKRPKTIVRPLGRYIRLPVEVQIRVNGETDHALYKRQQYMRVFPLWYPREIYEPLLKEI